MTRGADGLADLDRGQADAARRPQHQQQLAGLERGAPDKGAMGGAIGDGEAGGLGEAHAVGNPEDVAVPGHHLLGEAAMVEHGQHPVAGLHPLRRPRPRR